MFFTDAVSLETITIQILKKDFSENSYGYSSFLHFLYCVLISSYYKESDLIASGITSKELKGIINRINKKYHFEYYTI